MIIEPETMKAASIFGLGMVRDAETGEIRWNIVAGGILVAATIAVGGIIISMGNLIAAIEARQQMVISRLEAMESSQHPATSKRYTADDAQRDLELIRTRIRDAREEARKDNELIAARILRLEDRTRR